MVQVMEWGFASYLMMRELAMRISESSAAVTDQAKSKIKLIYVKEAERS
jgi:hypothetical protein